jgi:mono/diheme cytochrome c family protein
VRRRIFTGHPAGMPTWGVAGIPAREIDAVAAYILEQLRPDVLGGGAAAGQP